MLACFRLIAPVGAAKKRFEVGALSGTSGGAVCACLAWMDLLLDRAKVGKDGLKVSRFWKTGYPQGNAALPYAQAWMKDWQEFWSEGRLPWLHTIDRLRVESALALYSEQIFTDFSPVIVGVEANPYFFNRTFDGAYPVVPG